MSLTTHLSILFCSSISLYLKHVDVLLLDTCTWKTVHLPGKISPLPFSLFLIIFLVLKSDLDIGSYIRYKNQSSLLFTKEQTKEKLTQIGSKQRNNKKSEQTKTIWCSHIKNQTK